MGWSVNIGSIAGTVIRLHVTFLLFLGWIFFASYASGGPQAAFSSLAFMLLLFSCVVAHEFGHIFMARRFGVTTPTVTLLPIGGVVIAVALVLFFGASIDGRNLAGMDNGAVSMLDRLAAVNVFLVLFNMIPAFPMDGGRVLRAALASRLGYVRATEIAATIGQLTAFGLGFIGLFGNPLLIFIAIFVYLAAASEAQLVAVRAMSRGVPIGAAMITQFATLSTDAPIDEAVETLLRTSQNEFPVVDATGQPVGVLGRNDLIRAIKQHGPDARVADAMTSPLPIVSHRATLDEAFRVLQEKSAPAVGVLDAAGRLIGLVTSETIADMLMVSKALPRGVRWRPWSRPAGA
jgi:Zn-dependent protease/CBS domain-containing protein